LIHFVFPLLKKFAEYLGAQANRLTAAHEQNCLMLLGSPPDMVHSRPSHRTRQLARLNTRLYYYITFFELLQYIIYNFTCIFINKMVK